MMKFDLSKYLFKNFGCLNVIDYAYYNKEKKLNFLKAKCTRCGNIFDIPSNRLKNQKHLYCVKCPNKKEKIRLNKRLSRIYANMKSRCYNPKTNRYYIYGARGITVCDEWNKSYKAFENWALENGYQDNLTIDRIDNNGNYEPNNCRWVDYKTQRINSSNSKKITINDVTKSVTEWCEYYNLPYYILNNRLNKYGWSIKRAFETPIKKPKLYNYNGEKCSVKEISEKTNIPKWKIRRMLANDTFICEEEN